MNKRLLIDYVLRPHWKSLTSAFFAVTVESITDLMEPWPIKVVLDYVIGSIPILGDAFDVAWKANKMNVALLRRHILAAPAEQQRARSSDRRAGM